MTKGEGIEINKAENGYFIRQGASVSRDMGLLSDVIFIRFHFHKVSINDTYRK